jgi:hypothetical protein
MAAVGARSRNKAARDMNEKPPHEPSEAGRSQRRQRLTLWRIVIAAFAIVWSIIAKVASLL